MTEAVMKNMASGQCPDELTLQLYVDGETAAPAAELIFHHLAHCQNCAATLREMREARAFCLERLGEDDEREAAISHQLLAEARKTIQQKLEAASSSSAKVGWLARLMTLPRPVWLTTATALLLLAVLSVIWLSMKSISAAELLQRSAQAESQVGTDPSQVIHRTISFTASMPVRDTHFKVTRRIEIWKAPGRDLTIRRVFNERGELLGGRWLSAASKQSYYNRNIKAQMLIPALPGGIPTLEQLLNREFTTQDFQQLIGAAKLARVETKPDVYIINYSNEATGLVRATLTLRRTDLQPIAQTLVTRCRENLCESNYAEVGLEKLALATVAPSVFEPEPELIESSVNGKPASTPAPVVTR